MQRQVVQGDLRGAAPLGVGLADAWRDSLMLGVCSAPGCSTIVFGSGTCVRHDEPRLEPAGSLPGEAVGGETIVSGR